MEKKSQRIHHQTEFNSIALDKCSGLGQCLPLPHPPIPLFTIIPVNVMVGTVENSHFPKA